jgi:Glycosyl hydrolase family 26
VHNYHPWYSPFPNAADQYFVKTGKVLLLTWGGTPDTRKIVAGDYDSLISERARAVKQLHRPILLEFRHEMDRPNLQWAMHGPKNYIAAWDHIRKIFTKVGATNVGWVWCPTGWGFRHGRAQPFYPGNSEVDWVCADVYSVSASQTLQDAAHPFLTWARHTHKPVLIGEFAAGGSPSAWPRWLLAAGVLAEFDPQIKGMAYFDANGTDSQGRSFQYWLGDNAPALHVFSQMLSWPVFRPHHSSSQ